MYHFHLVDNLNKNDSYLSLGVFDDDIYEIKAGETETGYLYFSYEGHNYTYLVYTAGQYSNIQTYKFNIK